MTGKKNILSQNIPNDDDLMNYINNNLSSEKRHAIEMQMAENDFINDAVEGLEQFGNKQNIQNYVSEINHQLKKQTNKKRIRKHQRKLKSQQWLIVAIAIILLLCIVGYFVINQIEK
ncbi:MAG: hypothetical protein LC122_03290 [Chitinophagales bacterium]|nr:hypothetical protein [Chitinophagales bacterium]